MATDSKTEVNLSNWMEHPNSVWAFHHIDDLIACDVVSKGSIHQSKQTDGEPLNLDGFSVTNSEGTTFNLEEWHNATATDGFLVQLHGKILNEYYANGNSASSNHILMSATKSFVGLLLGILTAEGVVDVDTDVSTYIPSIAHTGYAGATLRNLIDMRAGAKVDMWDPDYRMAMGWTPGPTDGTRPRTPDMQRYFERLDVSAVPHGGDFHYVSQHTDLLGLALEKATGQSLAQLLSAKLWAPCGASTDALITVDGAGLARAAGGLCANVRDFAKLGQLVADGGYADGERGATPVVPPAWIDDTLRNGDARAWRAGNFAQLFDALYDRGAYRNGWYAFTRDGKTRLSAQGLHGQFLFVDPDIGLVVAKTSSQKERLGFKEFALSFRGFEEIRRIVLERERSGD